MQRTKNATKKDDKKNNATKKAAMHKRCNNKRCNKQNAQQRILGAYLCPLDAIFPSDPPQL